MYHRRYLAHMSDIIKLLPEHVANQIAAGEVIQRPASVVKELLDNAIDAQSTSIKILIKEGGKALIQVIDNGIGMSATDARMCWERHATSKIRKAEDIFSVKTMGFRGEALASIASVAHVTMKTRKPQDDKGTHIYIEGSQVITQEPVATPEGTSIAVKNLFFNIPARRNFLKSDAVELRHIIDEFTRAALANPMIAMSLYHNENDIFVLPAGSIHERILDLFGHQQEKHYLTLTEHTTLLSLTAFVGKPEYAKRTRGEQFIFVNNRYIKDAYLNHAVVSCYENLIAKEQYPFYILMLEVNPKTVDINVHPTKTEIKFEDEKSLYQIIKAVVKRALGEQYHIPTYESNSNEQLFGKHTVYPKQEQHDAFSIPKQHNRQDWQELYSVLQKKQETIGEINRYATQPVTEPRLMPETPSAQLFQLHGSIIISQIKSGIMLIDQQAAHERILYEKYLAALAQHPIASQQKLFPKTVTLNSHDESILKEMLPKLHQLGFDINDLGKNTFSINGLPSELQHLSEQELVEDLIESFRKQTSTENEIHERMARTIARKAAVKSGTKLGSEEMSILIDELFACSIPFVSPDGKPCLTRLTLEELYGLIKNSNR